MNRNTFLKSLCSALTVGTAFGSDNVRQSSQEARGGGRVFKWRGVVAGEVVTLKIKSARFDPDKHRFEERQPIDTVDGHPCLETSFLSPGGTHISELSVIWGGERLEFPSGVYSSVFHPILECPKDNFVPSEVMRNAVGVYAADLGAGIVITVPAGGGAQHWIAAFFISKSGQILRFTLGHIL